MVATAVGDHLGRHAWLDHADEAVVEFGADDPRLPRQQDEQRPGRGRHAGAGLRRYPHHVGVERGEQAALFQLVAGLVQLLAGHAQRRAGGLLLGVDLRGRLACVVGALAIAGTGGGRGGQSPGTLLRRRLLDPEQLQLRLCLLELRLCRFDRQPGRLGVQRRQQLALLDVLAFVHGDRGERAFARHRQVQQAAFDVDLAACDGGVGGCRLRGGAARCVGGAGAAGQPCQGQREAAPPEQPPADRRP